MTIIGEEMRLLPCPFCGSDAFLEIKACCYVRCISCCVDGPVFDNFDEDSDGDLEAVKLWNTRSPEAVTELANALVAKLDECAPHVANLSTMQFVRSGTQYTGPSYGEALEELRAALLKVTR